MHTWIKPEIWKAIKIIISGSLWVRLLCPYIALFHRCCVGHANIFVKCLVAFSNSFQGVKCFDYCKSLNLLVTGGLDHVVQLWNQYVTDWPVATFQGHSTTVLSTVIHESQGHVFSYSKDSVCHFYAGFWPVHASLIVTFNNCWVLAM